MNILKVHSAVYIGAGSRHWHYPSVTNCEGSPKGGKQTALYNYSPKGGFPTLHHNEVKDFTANLMAEVCHDLCIKPQPPQPITGETLEGASAITEDEARLDIAASGFWGGRHDRTFFNIRVFNPCTISNHSPVIESMEISRSRRMNSESGKSHMAHSLP